MIIIIIIIIYEYVNIQLYNFDANIRMYVYIGVQNAVKMWKLSKFKLSKRFTLTLIQYIP